jgi:hypothetical protein
VALGRLSRDEVIYQLVMAHAVAARQRSVVEAHAAGLFADAIGKATGLPIGEVRALLASG